MRYPDLPVAHPPLKIELVVVPTFNERKECGAPQMTGGGLESRESLNWRWSLSARQLIDLLAKISETPLAQWGSAGFALAQVRSSG